MQEAGGTALVWGMGSVCLGELSIIRIHVVIALVCAPSSLRCAFLKLVSRQSVACSHLQLAFGSDNELLSPGSQLQDPIPRCSRDRVAAAHARTLPASQNLGNV